MSSTERGLLQTLIDRGREAQLAGAWDEALDRFGAALALSGAWEAPAARADILRWVGEVYRERGDLDSAQEWTEKSRAEADAANQRDRVATALNSLGNIAIVRGDLGTAASYYGRGRLTAEAAGAEQVVAMADQNLGTIANIQGNATKALMSYRSALHRYRALGDEVRATGALNNMGMAHVDLGEMESADRCFAEAAELAERAGDTVTVGRVELNRAELHLRRHRYEDAFAALERSLEVFNRLGVKASIAEAYKLYGMLYVETGKPRQADTHFGLALDIAEQCQNRLLQAEIQLEWSLLHLAGHREEDGILRMNRALLIFRDLQAERPAADIERRLESLCDVYLPIVEAWGAGGSKGRDPYHAYHASRVADLAIWLATSVGVMGWDLTWLRIGALIHELGRRIDSGELYNEVRDQLEPDPDPVAVRARVGDFIAARLEFPEEVRTIVRNHREHWDGGGYPDGLSGEDIPLPARIVAIADMYDSLTSPRGSTPAHSPEEAIVAMECDAARKFDPVLWKAFQNLIHATGALHVGNRRSPDVTPLQVRAS